MQRSTVVLPQPEGPNSAVTPRAGVSNAASSEKEPTEPRKAALMISAAHHRPARATRFSISVIASMTIKAKIAMPAARILASRHCMVST